MKRLITTIILLAGSASLASACGPAQSGTLGSAPTGSPVPGTLPTAGQTTGAAPTSPATPTNASNSITIETWFTRGEKVFLTHRTRPPTAATSRLALTELIAGPSGLESAAGVGNAIPRDTTFTVSVSGGVATVGISGGFYDASGVRARLRHAQVVYTLTQFPTVSRVAFQKDGKPFGAPLARADFADVVPSIIVTSPGIGQRVSGTVTVTGMADVYESSVYVRLLDAAGKEIATAYTMTHCLPSCPLQLSPHGHGHFTATVAYRLASEQTGTLQVSGESADGSSFGDRATIPVVLAASGG